MLAFLNLAGESEEETTQVIAASVSILWSFKALKICGSHLFCYTTINRSNIAEIGATTAPNHRYGGKRRSQALQVTGFMLQSSKSRPAKV